MSKDNEGKKKPEVDEIQYSDLIGDIIKRAEQEGAFDNLKGKGKPLKLDGDHSYNPDRLLNKVMKDNNILPPWIQMDKEIERLKAELAQYSSEYNIRKSVEEINKKIFNYNLSCPPTAQKRKLKLEEYLPSE
ncbi:DUF1992 domain-containing protein [Pseudalkalibacillus sp. A8]|uniref:DnaJ family domain-containing protein n=1 Tax=Pseudalkalibacillus sp. A8 TaxID=3382641 RepID=UPI0038B42265